MGGVGRKEERADLVVALERKWKLIITDVLLCVMLGRQLMEGLGEITWPVLASK